MKVFKVSEQSTGMTKLVCAINENSAIVIAKQVFGFPLQGFYTVVEY